MHGFFYYDGVRDTTQYIHTADVVDTVRSKDPCQLNDIITVLGLFNHYQIEHMAAQTLGALDSALQAYVYCLQPRTSFIRLPNIRIIERDPSGWPTQLRILNGGYTSVSCGGPAGGPHGGGFPVFEELCQYTFGAECIDGGTGGGGGSGTINSPPVEVISQQQIRQELGNYLVSDCGGSWDPIYNINRQIGTAFEQAVLESFTGIPGVQQNRPFPSPARGRNVQPDHVTSLITHMQFGGGVHTEIWPELAWLEVKAYTTTIYNSTSNGQIGGMISALRHHANTNAPMRIPPGVPAKPKLIIATFDASNISPEVYTTAAAASVDVVQLQFQTVRKSDGNLYIRATNAVDVNTSSVHAVSFRDVAIRCPNELINRVEIDPETFNGG